MIVWVNGCFDLLHCGHLSFLRRAAHFGELTVFLNSDESVRSLKGPGRPIIPEMQRIKMLQSLPFVTGILTFDKSNPVTKWEGMRCLPSLYITTREGESEEKEYMLSNGIPVAIMPRIETVSTTNIIATIVARAAL